MGLPGDAAAGTIGAQHAPSLSRVLTESKHQRSVSEMQHRISSASRGETESVLGVTMHPGYARDRRSLLRYTRRTMGNHWLTTVDDFSSLNALHDNATLPATTAQMVTTSKLGSLGARKRFL